MKSVLTFVFCTALLSCSDNKIVEKNLSTEIQAFSGFMYRHPNKDTIERLTVYTFLFHNDTLISLGTDSLWNFKVTKAKLKDLQIDSINALIKQVRFKSLINNSSYEEFMKAPYPYCYLDFGFIDSIGNPQVYMPGDVNPSRLLIEYLENIKGRVTTDSTQIIKFTHDITKLYRTKMPPIPMLRAPEDNKEK